MQALTNEAVRKFPAEAVRQVAALQKLLSPKKADNGMVRQLERVSQTCYYSS